MLALEDLVKGPENIIAAARVSNRIVIFPRNKELVEEFLVSHGGITIDSQFIKGRKYDTTNKIILSNVSPIIPNSTLKQHLKKEFGSRIFQY